MYIIKCSETNKQNFEKILGKSREEINGITNITQSIQTKQEEKLIKNR